MENLGVNQRRFLKFIMFRKQEFLNDYEIQRVRLAITNDEYRNAAVERIVLNDIRERFKGEFDYWSRPII